jgi:3-isopropylmalate/(R)-2-methylmalate dehydratase small subunit
MEAVREIISRAVPLDRSDVDTDQTIPSDWLKRPSAPGSARDCSRRRERSDWLNQSRYDGAHILVAGNNFDRSSAARAVALQDYGFQAIISPRFADIFRNNCLKIGSSRSRCRSRS